MSRAQPEDKKTTSLSLDQFSGLVTKGLPADALVRAGVLSVEADVDRARALPELAVSLERQEVFVDGDGVALQNSVAIGWSLDVSGRRGLRIDAAEARLRAARLRGDRSHSLIAINAIAIYLRAAHARLRLESLKKSSEPLVRLSQNLNLRAEEGDVSGADAARFELAVLEHADRTTAAAAQAEIAEKQLAALLGRTGRIVASDDLAIPRMPAEASPIRPDLLAANHELTAGRALIGAASRWWVPTVDLSGGYLATDFGPGIGPGADVAHGYLATVSLSLPVFSRGQAERKLGEAQVALAQAAETVLERRVRAEVEAARTLLSSRIDRVVKHEAKRLVLASVLVQKTESAYLGGEATALELRDAYAQSADAQLDAVDLRFEVSMAELDLWRAQGTKSEGSSR